MTRDRHPDKFADHEAVFVDIATHGDPKDLRVEVSEWEQDINYDEAVTNAEYDAWGRELFFNQSYGGRWNMQAEFGVADGQFFFSPALWRGRWAEERGPETPHLCNCQAALTVSVVWCWFQAVSSL
jgi:hypothetical protein